MDIEPSRIDYHMDSSILDTMVVISVHLFSHISSAHSLT